MVIVVMLHSYTTCNTQFLVMSYSHTDAVFPTFMLNRVFGLFSVLLNQTFLKYPVQNNIVQ